MKSTDLVPDIDTEITDRGEPVSPIDATVGDPEKISGQKQTGTTEDDSQAVGWNDPYFVSNDSIIPLCTGYPLLLQVCFFG